MPHPSSDAAYGKRHFPHRPVEALIIGIVSSADSGTYACEGRAASGADADRVFPAAAFYETSGTGV